MAFIQECYNTYKTFYDMVLDYGYAFTPTNKTKTDLNVSHINVPMGLDSRHILAITIEITRNISGIPLVPGCTRSERRKVESIIKNAITKFPKELAGEYYPIDITNNNIHKDLSYHPSKKSFLMKIGCANDWPDARGIFISTSKNILIYVNHKDHIRVVSTETGGNFVTIFDRLCKVLAIIESQLHENGNGKFMYQEHYGYLTTCPSQLGSGDYIYIYIYIILIIYYITTWFR
jgi:creatine kinase